MTTPDAATGNELAETLGAWFMEELTHTRFENWSDLEFGEALAPLVSSIIEAAVTEAEERARRQALTEAADAWTQGEWALAHGLEGKLSRAQFVGDWLRARSDVLAARAAGGSK